jgi:hypothetical protein
VLRALSAVGITGAAARNAVEDRRSADGFPALPAVVNHGRWLTYCDRCAGAEIVFDDGWFLCVSCIVEDRGVRWRHVAFPAERRAIEEALAPRGVENRNWEPGESVTFLLAENKEHRL